MKASNIKHTFRIILICLISFSSCSDDDNNQSIQNVNPIFTFNHNWNGESVTNDDFNTIQYTTENGEMLSIERLRYVVSDMTFTGLSGEVLNLDNYNLVDVTNNNGLTFSPSVQIPPGTYNVSFTFGLDNEDNSQNYPDLNSASFNVPENLGGGYHYMQFDGKFINSNDTEQGFNYHAIRAVDNPGPNPTFPQDTFFTVNLGQIDINANTEIEVDVNLAEWFKNPNTWDLNQFNQMLMPNSAAQIMMFENGQTVFSLAETEE